ncbi:MAG: complex I NDUFA9 subunit family protein [Paracoccaceae bacterium]
MKNTPPIVTIFGGSGFVGRYIALKMARAGWRVRVAVRRPNEAMYVKTYGTVGQVEPILANVRNATSVKQAIAGVDAVVNCVGILHENPRQKFAAVHAEAAGRIARIATSSGVGKFVHLSSIGADHESSSIYARTKAEGEDLVRKHFPKAVILRPSVVFGVEDQFLNRFAALAQISPIIPLVGAETRFQPVYVDDIAAAAAMAIAGDIRSGIYELGGPEVKTLREIIQNTLHIIRRKRLIINIPFGIAALKAWGFDMVALLSRGLIPAMISRDQVKQLRVDNVVHDGAAGFADFGITPTAMEGVIEDYLYCYRPHGQFTAITASGKNL